MALVIAHGVTCECGSAKLARSPSESGQVLLCTKCARAYASIPWSTVEREIATRPADLFAFEWLRGAVPPELRCTLPEPLLLPASSRRAERVGAVLGVTLALLFLLVACRAVFS